MTHDAIEYLLSGSTQATTPAQKRKSEALMATQRSAKKSTALIVAMPPLAGEQVQQWRAQTFAANRDAIILTDVTGVILDWNPAAEVLYGYTRAAAIGQPAALICQSAEADGLMRRILVEMASQGSWMGEITFVRQDGSVGVTETRVAPLLDDAGNIIGAFGVSRDITKRPQVAADLLHAALAREATVRLQLATIFDTVSDELYVYDAQGEVTPMNAAGRAHLGLDADQSSISGTLTDERAAAEARERALTESNVRLHTFLGIAGHELRTPVTSMKAQVQLAQRAVSLALKENLTALAASKLERALTLLASADQQTNRLNRLIDDVLDLTRIQSGKLELRCAPAQPGDVVREAVEQQRHAWPGRDLTVTIAEDAGVTLDLDGDRIGQVVTNLLTNALKYSTEDRPVAVVVSRLSSAVRVAVTDQGPGLTPAEQDHLWDPFHQVTGVQQQSGSGVGLGLGLHICHTIIDRHAGRMGVASVVGQGSTFWFDLPTTDS